MSAKKKMQVFVSSTYTDMLEERQAAVEAILQAGHIPAGMELFAPGNQSQLEVIYNWIDESDIYLLILGGRYGSLDPNTGKSYTHLEYEYAISKGKPHFALIIDTDFYKRKVEKPGGLSFTERNHPKLLEEFQEIVRSSRIVKFFENTDQIKLAIFQTLSNYEREEHILGWVRRGYSIDNGIIAEQLAKLTEENERLRARTTNQFEAFTGLSFDDLYSILSNEFLDFNLEFIRKNIDSDSTSNAGRKYSEILMEKNGQTLLAFFLDPGISWNDVTVKMIAKVPINRFLQLDLLSAFSTSYIVTSLGKSFREKCKLIMKNLPKEE